MVYVVLQLVALESHFNDSKQVLSVAHKRKVQGGGGGGGGGVDKINLIYCGQQ